MRILASTARLRMHPARMTSARGDLRRAMRRRGARSLQRLRRDFAEDHRLGELLRADHEGEQDQDHGAGRCARIGGCDLGCMNVSQPAEQAAVEVCGLVRAFGAVRAVDGLGLIAHRVGYAGSNAAPRRG